MELCRFSSFLIMLTVLHIHFFPTCGNLLWIKLWRMWKSVSFQQLFLLFTELSTLWINLYSPMYRTSIHWLSPEVFQLILPKLFYFPVKMSGCKVTNLLRRQKFCEKPPKTEAGIICDIREILSPDNHFEEEDPCRGK